MKTRFSTYLLVLLGLVVGACGGPDATDDGHALNAGDLRRSGTIHLPVACKPEVANDFETAVALLHSFFYDEARRRFEEILKLDPDCAMAWWGIAMTWYHPLWAPPTAEERGMGLMAASEASVIGGKSELERGLIDAILTFYTTTEKLAEDSPNAQGRPGTLAAGCSCCGPQAHGARALAFRGKMEQLHERFPDNVEVITFYALSLIGTAMPTDKAYTQQRRAAAMLEPLFESNPNHPGIAHYIIHAYDYPELADRALVAARKYDDIAPWVAHALHMPTHIYTRLGMWQDSIDGNIASSAAARDHAARNYEGRAIMDDLHAMDYLMFAYLQTGRDSKAREVLADLGRIEAIQPGNSFASAYAAAAIPARYALERRDWSGAAQLKLLLPDFVGDFPMAVAHIEFARAVGAARSRNTEVAKVAVSRLSELCDELRGSRFDWWTEQVEIQKVAAEAWLAHAQGDPGRAEILFRRAAKIEDTIGTHPVTPGQILPVREQLGDLLLEIGKPAAALVEFERSLKSFPRRFLSHQGAAQAAQQLGKTETANAHYRSLLEMAGDSTDRGKAINAARQALGA